MDVRLWKLEIGLGLFVGGCTPVGPGPDGEPEARWTPAAATPAAPEPEPDPEPGALGGIVQVVASGNATCALDSAGAVYCWGIFTGGTYEDPSEPLFGFSARRPVLVEGPKATRIAAYPRGVGMLDTHGSLFVSGRFERAGRDRRSFESLGGENIQRLFSARSRAEPLCWLSGEQVWECRAGERHEFPPGVLVDERAPGCFAEGNAVQCNFESPWLSAALDGDCGEREDGMEGIRRFDFGAPPTQLYASPRSICALAEDGALECVHRQSTGTSVGCGPKGTSVRHYTQLRERWPGPFVDASLDDDHGLGFAAHANGAVVNLDHGTAVLGATNIVQLTASVGHTCGLSQDGHVWCWGDNNEGQLGNGTEHDEISTQASLVLAPKGPYAPPTSGGRAIRPARSSRHPDVGSPPSLCPPL